MSTAIKSGLHIYDDVAQGTDAWHALRRGIVTASVIDQLITKGSPDGLAVDCPQCQAGASEPCISTARKVPTPIKTVHDERRAKASNLPPVIGVAANDTSRALTAHLVAERITGYTEPSFVSADMERGNFDEPFARGIYSETYAEVAEVGFMILNGPRYQLGYSPDGLVGNDGLIEVKSRRQKKHLQTILADEVPAENIAQIQCGLLVSGREWCDYISYCGGMPMWTKRVHPDQRWFEAITETVTAFEENAAQMIATYTASVAGLPMTERIELYADMEF